MQNYLDTKMPVNLIQYRRTVGVSNNRKFTQKLQYKETSKLKLIHTCFIADFFYLRSHSMVSIFVLLVVIFLLKPKVLKWVKFSAFAMFYVICIYLLLVKWLYKIFLIWLSVDVDHKELHLGCCSSPRSASGYCNGNTTSQGKTLENVTSQFGFHQVIKESTHILHNSSSCIDLIFASQPDLIIESGVHPSLHRNCHHQIIYANFNLQIYYPAQHYSEVWHYNDANTELIRRAVDQFK